MVEEIRDTTDCDGRRQGPPAFWNRLETVVGVAAASTVAGFVALIEVLTTLSDQPRGLPLLVAAGLGAFLSSVAVTATQTGHRVSAGIAGAAIVALLAFWASRAGDRTPNWATTESTETTEPDPSVSSSTTQPVTDIPSPEPVIATSMRERATDELLIEWRALATPLVRSQAPAPETGSKLGTPSAHPTNWRTSPTVGLAYRAGEDRMDRVPGLIPIYRLRCVMGCDEYPIYDLSSTRTPRQGWEWDGEAFQCFDPTDPPAGTRPLRSLVKGDRQRTWAVPGTDGYEAALDDGFHEPDDEATLCYIWPADGG